MDPVPARAPHRTVLKIRTSLNNNNPTSDLKNLSSEEMGELGVDLLEWDSEDRLRAADRTCRISSSDEEEEEINQNCKRSKLIMKDRQEENYEYRKKHSSSSRCQQAVFSWLSDEMVLGILRHLPHRTLAVVAEVCRRFSGLVKDETLWRRLDLGRRYLPTDTIGYIIQRQPRVLRMAKTKIPSPAFDKTRDMMANFVCKLEYLDLSESTMSPEDLECLLSKCYSLKKLSLEGCEMNHKVLLAISQNQSLDTLNLVLCTNLTVQGLENVCKNCRRLESVNLGWTSLKAHSMSRVCRMLPASLRELNISGSLVLDEDILRLSRNCPNLVELDISDCWVLTPAAVKIIAKDLRKLRGISLSRCFKIHVQDLEYLRGLPQLERVNMFKTGVREGDVSAPGGLLPGVRLNTEVYSRIARPTVGDRRTSIWEVRCRE